MKKREHEITQKAVRDNRQEILVKKMSELKIGQEDLRSIDENKLNVKERLIQVIGHLYQYDYEAGINI
jgi:hypothetical protein